MANPAFYDFFRKILLQPDASESATPTTLEADSTTDTLTINGGPGVRFSPNETGDTFDINVDYQMYVPIGSTNIRLEDANNNLQDITIRAGSGVQVFRENNNQIAISAYGVAESDTLHTVAKRGRITDQNLIVNGITVGTVNSAAGVDGMAAQDARFIGDGTLNSPLQLLPTEREITTDPYSETFTFTTANGAGILGYQIGMDPASTLTTAYEFTLEREDPSSPGNWIIIENESQANSGDQIFAANQYAEAHAGSVNWRLIVTASGFVGHMIELQANFTFEVYDVAATPVLVTDSATGNITVRDVLPSATGTNDIGASGNTFANVYADLFTGALSGNVTGNVSGNAGTATALETGRTFSISGAVTATGISFDGTQDVILNTSLSNTNISQFTNDSNFIALTALSATGDITYNNTTGVISYTAPTNVSEFTNDASYITLTNLSASGDISYNNTTGVISFTQRTDAEVRGLISGTGDISYNNTTGVISFTERTDAEVRGLISGTGDITYNNTTGVISFNNTSGYLTSYTETDTLDSVVGRGASTTTAITTGGLTVNGNSTLGQSAASTLTLNLATSATDRTTGYTVAPAGFLQVTINGATVHIPYYT